MHGISWIRSSTLTLVLGVALATPAGAAMPDAGARHPCRHAGGSRDALRDGALAGGAGRR